MILRGPVAILKAFGLFRAGRINSGRSCACKVCAPSPARVVMNTVRVHVRDIKNEVARILARTPAPAVPDFRAAIRAEHAQQLAPRETRDAALRAAFQPKEVK